MVGQKLEIKIINNSSNDLPTYSTPGSAGMDVRAFIPDEIFLEPMERRLIPTGIFVEIPPGFELQVRPRSGLAFKNGITVLNTPGTIDSDFRGELHILLINLGQEKFTIQNGDRIAQLVPGYCLSVTWQPTTFLTDTQRGEGGYGHTGKA